MNAQPASGPAAATLDPVELFEIEARQEMTLVRLVLCAALAVAILAIASRLMA